jgi:hypothetical protein
VLNKPIMFTEFGADAFNVIKSEDQKSRLIICWVMEGNLRKCFRFRKSRKCYRGLLFNLVMAGGNTGKQKLRHSIIMRHGLMAVMLWTCKERIT